MIPPGDFRVVPCPGDAAWLRERRGGVGGSEAGVVWGCSLFRSRLELYAEKRGAEVERDDDADWLEEGKDLEWVIARTYARRTGARLVDPGRTTQLVSTRWPWMRVTLDRIILEHPERGDPGILEAKNRALRPGIWNDWRGGAPLEVVMQVQHGLAVTGWRWGSIAAFVMGRTVIVDLERDDELIELHVERCRAFMADVEAGREPPADASESSRRAIAALYPREVAGERVELPAEAAGWHRKGTRAASIRARVEKIEAECKNRLRQSIGAAEVGVLPDGSVWTLKTPKGANHRRLHWKRRAA